LRIIHIHIVSRKTYDAIATLSMNSTPKPIRIVVTSDFICPWCWIGHRRLADGVRLAGLEVRPEVAFMPYEMNPAMPAEGVSRRQYRTGKFGSWARSQAMDAEVALAGSSLGLIFNFDSIEITPRTRLAQRLRVMAQANGDREMAEALFDTIFAAYFTAGRDIGSLDVLVDLAVSAGLDGALTREYLNGSGGEEEIAAAQAQGRKDGICSLPTVRIDGRQVSGAQPASVLAETLREAARVIGLN
jgi:predicted DsbA family dithiol-disulfide isomerase